MYSVINKYFSNAAPYDRLTSYNHPREEYLRRMDVIRNFIIDLGLKVGVKQEKLNNLEVSEGKIAGNLFIHLKVSWFGVADDDNVDDDHLMVIPATLLYDFEKDVDDLKKDNTHEDLMQKMDDVEWVKKNIFDPFLGKKELESSDAELLRDNCRILIRDVNENPEKIFNMLRFAIIHELGHINNNDNRTSRRSLIGFNKLYLVASLTSIVGLEYFIATRDLSVITRLFLGGISLRYAMIFAYQMWFYVPNYLNNIFIARPQEIAADRFAATAISGDEGKKICQGGIDCGIEFRLQKEDKDKHDARKGIKRNNFISPIIRYLEDTHHPTPEARIKMIEEHLAATAAEKQESGISENFVENMILMAGY